jgi:hypothetical protein
MGRGCRLAAVATVVVLLMSAFSKSDALKSCTKTTTPKGVTTKCSPLGLTDVAPILVITILALLPDMSEAGFLGFSLKRRVAEQEAKQGELDERVRNFELRLAQSQNQSQVVIVGDTSHLKDRIAEKEAALDQLEQLPAEEIAELSPEPTRTALEREVLRLADNLRVWERIASAPIVPVEVAGETGMTEVVMLDAQPVTRGATQPLIRQWRDLFDEEIHSVIAASDAVNAQPGRSGIADDSLRDLVSAGNYLLEVLKQRLHDVPEAPEAAE